jgi:hypothetical protein
MNTERWWYNTDKGNGGTLRKTSPKTTTPTTNPTWTRLGSSVARLFLIWNSLPSATRPTIHFLVTLGLLDVRKLFYRYPLYVWSENNGRSLEALLY